MAPVGPHNIEFSCAAVSVQPYTIFERCIQTSKQPPRRQLQRLVRRIHSTLIPRGAPTLMSIISPTFLEHRQVLSSFELPLLEGTSHFHRQLLALHNTESELPSNLTYRLERQFPMDMSIFPEPYRLVGIPTVRLGDLSSISNSLSFYLDQYLFHEVPIVPPVSVNDIIEFFPVLSGNFLKSNHITGA